MALRAALTASAPALAHDVPKMMCQILQQLVQDHNTVRLIRYKKSHSARRHKQNTSVNLLQWLNNMFYRSVMTMESMKKSPCQAEI
jgi:hypothetical protein